IEYLRDLVGARFIGLGSDFDGISSTPPGLSDPTDVPQLLARLRERGFSEEEVQSIAGGNWRRLFQRVLKA
ncbi:MAG: membrane dipeptidase, partial [Bacteroidota bacterium]